MPAYLIANVEVKDPVRYEDYKTMVPSSVSQYGGKFVARGGKIDVLEGDWHPTRLVIIEFPSADRAREWWHCAEYADAKALRQATSKGTLLILEGV